MFKCPECHSEFKTLKGLRRHCSMSHGMNHAEVHVRSNLNGVYPTCACGCGNSTLFYSENDAFAKYHGHHEKVEKFQERQIESQKVYESTGSFLMICPLCDFKCKQKPKFEKHLLDVHNVIDVQSFYDEYFLKSSRPTCKCGCGQDVKWWGWEQGYPAPYVRGHNARDFTMFSDPEVAKASAIKRSEGYQSGKYSVWNDGLTKETSPTILSGSIKAGETLHKMHNKGEIVIWSKGLSVETSEGLRAGRDVRLRKIASGEIKVWNKGLTKETDDRLRSIGQNIRLSTIESHHCTLDFDIVKQRVSKSSVDCMLLSERESYRNKNSLLSFQCNKCNKTFERVSCMAQLYVACPTCYPNGSRGQLEIYEFVKSICPATNVLSCDRMAISPLELDIFVPSHNFAIEYNGLYWHSEIFQKDNNYHQNKTDMCNKNGIELLHVYEDEWKFKREIVESMIRQRLNKTIRQYDINQLEVKELTSEQRVNFFHDNHLDGDAIADIAFGLFNENLLVAAMSLHKIDESKNVELVRFAHLLNTSTPQAFTRLLLIALEWAQNNHYKIMMCYVDERHSHGECLEKAGFSLENVSEPQLWLTDCLQRYDVSDCSDDLSDLEIPEELNLFKIYGCRTKLFRHLI